jgi:hypothetical protein
MPQMVQETVSAAEIESLFNGISGALRIAIRIYEVKISSDGDMCFIRSYDQYGRLPDIQIAFSRDMEETIDRLCICVARMGMAVRFRQELAAAHCGCSFLLPVSKRKATLVGIRAGDKTIVAKGSDACCAYQELKKAVETSLKIA